MLLKKSSISFYIFSFLLTTLNFQGSHHLTNNLFFSSASSSTALACPNVCQVTDSLALVALYNATMGAGWTMTWDLNEPVCTPWAGVELDGSGYVISIQLSSNNLTGTLPTEIGDFSRIHTIQIDNNNISGNLTPEIGDLSELTILFLDNNDFTGTVPSSYGSLSKLEVLFLDNNDLSGPIPESFTNLTFLQKLDIFNNDFDSLPDLSAINIQPNKLRIFNNNLTFDDILPNSATALGDNYFPQDSIFETMTVPLNTGATYTIDLDIDDDITDNSYQWYRNGIPFGAPLNVNRLTFSPVTWGDAGTYNCTVTNPNAPQLSLYSRDVHIIVNCGSSIYNYSPNLCGGESVFVNGTEYHPGNPTGTEVLAGMDQFGCDSIVEVNLNYFQNAEHDIIESFCGSESIIVNGTTYDEGNPTGTETFTNGSANGCDSIVNIDLNYDVLISETLAMTLCNNDTIIANGNIYDVNNPTGSEFMANGSVNGCDSTVILDLDFLAAVENDLITTLCHGEEMIVNGQVYNAAHPNGTENILAASTNGCDSIIYIDLTFYAEATDTLNQTLCNNESIIVNGTTYDESHPEGTEFLNGAGVNGCDSTVVIDLNFSEDVSFTFDPTLCDGEEVIVNGTTYNQAMPTGTELMPGSGVGGCDSTVMVDLTFFEASTFDLTTTLCHGESIVVNGVTYDQATPNGVETLENASFNGCDSTVTIQLSFYDSAGFDLTTTLCDGESILVNGETYDAFNPTGTEILENANYLGCDSTVQINLSFYNPVVIDVTDSICEGAFFIIENDTFSTSGNYVVTLENASAQGCDSTVMLDLFVITDAMLGLADAGEDFALCEGTQTSIEAIQPAAEITGKWTTTSGTIIDDSENYFTDLNNLPQGFNDFVWTLSSEQCPDYHADEMTIYVEEIPQAADDDYVFSFNSESNQIELFDNDQFSENAPWFFELLSSPDAAAFDEIGNGEFEFTPERGFAGMVDFEYQLCSESCPDLCTIAKVRIQIEEPDFSDVELPNGITPNGDGVNEAFVIPHLEYLPEQYADREFIVFNRWGDIVYQTKPYLNNWRGQNQNGEALPLGTYYFVLRLDIGEGEVLKGDITILK